MGAYEMSVEFKGGDALRRLSLAKRMFPMNKLLLDASLLAQRTARERAPRDTGALQRSIAFEVKPFEARVYTPLVYAPVMEFGRKPGAKMPPPAALEGWVRRHWFGGVSRGNQNAIRSSAFVLARSISRRGIKGRFFMKAAHDRVKSEMPRLLREMAQRIERVFEAGR